MEWVETTGKSVEEAKEAALDQLGVDEGDAEFEVVEEPKPGLFGRIRGEARVRARVRPTQPRPKVERRERRRRTPDGAKETSEAKKTSKVGAAGPAAAKQPAVPPARKEPKVSESRSEGNGAGGAQVQGDAASTFLLGLAEAFGVSASADVEMVADNEVEVRLNGDDLGLLIGPRGQTLQAVQDLTRLAVQRHDDDRSARLRIDIAGYRERRREALSRFTEQVVAQVVSSGEPRALEPMSAADRKVVHDTVNTLSGVATRSEGEDPFRRVVILPADA
jgi:spoIIIJ-associated protein